MPRCLFVTYDAPETTYLEGLFFPLFAAMRPHGVEVEVLQLTWGEARERRERAAARHGIRYRAVHVPGGGTARTGWILARGPAAIRASMAGIDVLYPRSVLPLGAALRVAAPRLVFDADGLVADERVDFAGWSPTGAATRLYRWLEVQGVRRADRVICRTARAREILLARAGSGVDPAKVVAIPNGKDPGAFRPASPLERSALRAARGIPDGARQAVYAGSVGPQYHLDEMLAFHRAMGEGARLTLLTRAPLSPTWPGVDVVSCTTEEVPDFLRAADVGLAFRTPSFSMAGVSPIKVAEYLLCGLPVVTNRGIGDLDTQLADCAGVHRVPDFSSASLAAAAAWRGDPAAARAAGLAWFDLARVAEATAQVLTG